MAQVQGRTILVIGATGQQGGAVAQALGASGGWRVRALTRQPDGERAQALKARGMELVSGDMNDIDSLVAAMRGAYGVFSMQASAGQSVDDEVRQGKNAAEAARISNIQHFVFTSVCGAERRTDVPHFDSKGTIEAHIRSLGLPFTIVRPVSFMDNFNRNKDGILAGRLSGLLAPNAKNWYVAVQDIGSFVASAFARPASFLGQAINLAGAELTMTQTAEAFSRGLGRTVTYTQIPSEDAQRRMPAEMLTMNAWFERVGYQVDVPALRTRWGVPFMGLEEWIRRAGWTAKAA